MSFLFINGKKPKRINIDNVLYFESREEYTTVANKQLITTVKFNDGSVLDIKVNIKELSKALENFVSGGYQLDED